MLTESHIITVTMGGILYRDDAGAIGWIDFKECAQNRLNQLENLGELDRRCVGILHTYPHYIKFSTRPRPIRFDFPTLKALRDFDILLEERFRWYTWDAT